MLTKDVWTPLNIWEMYWNQIVLEEKVITPDLSKRQMVAGPGKVAAAPGALCLALWDSFLSPDSSASSSAVPICG